MTDQTYKLYIAIDEADEIDEQALNSIRVSRPTDIVEFPACSEPGNRSMNSPRHKDKSITLRLSSDLLALVDDASGQTYGTSKRNRSTWIRRAILRTMERDRGDAWIQNALRRHNKRDF